MSSGLGDRRSIRLTALVVGAVWAVFTFAFVFAFAAEGRARADEGPATDKRTAARAKLIDGDQFLKSGEFQQALTAFKQAYELFASPKIHYNFALAYQGMGRNADALEAFDAFLNDAPDAQPDVRDRARTAREGLLRQVGLLRVTADAAGAQVVIDGRDVGRTPLSRAIPLDPGPHLLLVERGAGAAPYTQRFEIAAGVTVAIHATPVDPAPLVGTNSASGPTVPARGGGTGTDAAGPPPDSGEPTDGTRSAVPGRGWRVAGAATAAGGALLIGGGALFGLAARSASQDVSRQFDGDRDAAGERSETLQWVGYGLGSAALVTGALLYLYGARVDSRDSAPAVHALVTPHGVLVEGHF